MNKNSAKIYFNCNNSPVLTILGGSQGSTPINNHFKKNYSLYTNLGINILWQCGKKQYEHLQDVIQDNKVKLIPFSDNMGALYSASDIIISRSGALALSEMALMGKAMILIPFPFSANNHQMKNAESFSNSDAAIVIPESHLNSGKLENIIMELFDNPKKIQTMEEKAKILAKPNATNDIINIIMEIAES